MRLMDRVELDEWLGRARRTWSPIKVAGRQFDAIVRDDGDVPGVAAYDHLYDAANLAVAWLDDNPCPDESVATRFRAQMMAYRAIADTVRSTIADEDGDRMVEQLGGDAPALAVTRESRRGHLHRRRPRSGGAERG